MGVWRKTVDLWWSYAVEAAAEAGCRWWQAESVRSTNGLGSIPIKGARTEIALKRLLVQIYFLD